MSKLIFIPHWSLGVRVTEEGRRNERNCIRVWGRWDIVSDSTKSGTISHTLAKINRRLLKNVKALEYQSSPARQAAKKIPKEKYNGFLELGIGCPPPCTTLA